MVRLAVLLLSLLAGVEEKDGARTLFLEDGEVGVALGTGGDHPFVSAAEARVPLRPARVSFGRASLRGLIDNTGGVGLEVDEALGALVVTGEDGAEIATAFFAPVRFEAPRRAFVFAASPRDQIATGDFAPVVEAALAAATPLAGPLRVEGRTVRIGSLTILGLGPCQWASTSIEARGRAERETGGPAVVVSIGDEPPGSRGLVPSYEVVRIEPLAPPSPRSGVKTRRVWMKSPAPSGDPRNDVFPVEEWVPKEKAPASIIVLPMWKGGILLAERIVAAHLAERGYLAAILPLPYMMQRSPPGVTSGDLTVSSDLPRTEAALKQALADVHAVEERLLELSFEEETSPRLGVLGISLGAHVAAVAYRDDPWFSAGVFVMAGGDPASMVWAASSETRRMKEEIVAQGVTLEDLRRFFRPMDPAAFPAPPAFPGFGRYRGVLMVNGTKDTVVPPENAKLLWKALNEPEILWFPETHYSMANRIPEILEATDRHLDRIFRP